MIDARWYPPGDGAPEAVPLTKLDERRDGLLWVDVSDPTPETLATLREVLQLDPVMAGALGDRHPRSRLLPWGTTRHATLGMCSLVDDRALVRIIELVFGPGLLLTVRWGDAARGVAPYPIEPIRSSFVTSRSSGGPSGLGGALWAIFDLLVEDAFDMVEHIDDQLDAGEEIVFDEEIDRTIPRELFDLRRTIAALRRAIAPARDVASGLLRTESTLLPTNERIALERAHDHLLRLFELVDGQRDLLAGLLDAHLAINANHTNEVMKRTSSWGAILVGATLIVGYYGMNFDDMPEFGWPNGWLWALGLILGVTTTLIVVFRRKDWL